MSYRTSVQMDEELAKLVKEYAKQAGTSVSEAIKINMAHGLWDWQIARSKEEKNDEVLP